MCCHRLGHISSVCPGKGEGDDVSAGLFPKGVMNEAIPVLDVHVNRIKRVALVYMGCSQSLASTSILAEGGDILTINGNSLKNSGVRNI